MTNRVKPATSDNSPSNANSGNELAVWGRACATSAAGGAAATAAGGVWTTAVIGTSSPVGWIAVTGTLFNVSTGTAVVVSTGISRTGSFTIFASSIARFFG